MQRPVRTPPSNQFPIGTPSARSHMCLVALVFGPHDDHAPLLRTICDVPNSQCRVVRSRQERQVVRRMPLASIDLGDVSPVVSSSPPNPLCHLHIPDIHVPLHVFELVFSLPRKDFGIERSADHENLPSIRGITQVMDKVRAIGLERLERPQPGVHPAKVPQLAVVVVPASRDAGPRWIKSQCRNELPSVEATDVIPLYDP